MNRISYVQTGDELVLQFEPLSGRPNKDLGTIKFWWNDDGTYRGIRITSFTDLLNELRGRNEIIKLAGIWQGALITEEDLRISRAELLHQLDKKL